MHTASLVAATTGGVFISRARQQRDALRAVSIYANGAMEQGWPPDAVNRLGCRGRDRAGPVSLGGAPRAPRRAGQFGMVDTQCGALCSCGDGYRVQWLRSPVSDRKRR